MKRWISLLLIALLLLNGQPVEAKGGDVSKQCLALNYHRLIKDDLFTNVISLLTSNKELNFYSIKDSEFEAQMDWLVAHDATFVTEETLIQDKQRGKFPERCVWVNFDDMDQSALKLAHPILKERGIPATGFVITGHVGDDSFHNLKLIDLKGLKEMEASGIWQFNSHTHDLHNLKRSTSDLVKHSSKAGADIDRSVKYLDQHFNKKATSLAYPYGQYDDTVIDTLEHSAIRHAYVLKETPIHVDDDNYTLPRILVSRDSFEKVVKNWKGFN